MQKIIISIEGRGAEIVAGRVNRKVEEFYTN